MEEFITQIQEFCKDLSTMADYFVTVGMTEENIKNHVLHNQELNPVILSQFPPILREGAIIPGQLPMVGFK